MKIKNQEKRWGYAHLTAADAPKHNNERNQMRRVNTTGKADGKGRDVHAMAAEEKQATCAIS